MSEEHPQATQVWPPRSGIVWGLSVGDKCIVNWLPDEDGDYWLEAGGRLPEGGGGIDTAQARVYYRCAGEEQVPEVRVILPDDAPFRACRKGMRLDRSKSFDENGDPVPQVRLLYALKTKRYDDRLRAAEIFPPEVWGNPSKKIFDWEALDALHYYASTDDAFRVFAGEQLARSASLEKGLSEWALWEKVADDAAEFTRRLQAIAQGEALPNNHSRFVQAVKDTTVEFHGLTAQTHVRDRWQTSGGIGEWKEIRKTLGFEWIPAKSDWESSWRNREGGLPPTR